MSQVITFYSYKGGVGRSMALANVAVLSAQSGYKTLIVDWDLEAPGLELFFKDYIDIDAVRRTPGLIELLQRKTTWQEILHPIAVPNGKEPIHIITAGRHDEDYYSKVLHFDHERFFEEEDGGQYLESLRDNWLASYDLVLIDSRTGVTDIGGICTIQMPDILVLLFTSTEQGFSGILDISKRADAARQLLPFERSRLLCLPVLTRFEPTEFALSREWISNFASRLDDIYRPWLPTGTSPNDMLLETKVPYIPYFSFGEKLAVLEQNTRDTTGLGYAYASLAALLLQALNDADQFLEDRVAYIDKARIGSMKSTRIKPRLKVFISYSRRDEWIKEALLAHLSVLERTLGVEFLSEDDIMPGEEWIRALSEKIESADVYIILISTEYLSSEFSRGELQQVSMNLAEMFGKSIIPILMEPLEREQVPIELQKYKYLSLKSGDSMYVQNAADEIRRVLTKLAESEKKKKI